ncbi:MAG TPA: flagellar hook-length control protein FliK [Rhodanobacteraceae bacterium]|nr:flagellar hook-length control protein FliK [Rhodanobacteraceae bacterium]
MSGITPILDTLLHQVLGRRDTPVDRPLPDQLIAPARAGLPPQSAHSDSRLDPRPLPTARTTIGRGDKVNVEPASRGATASVPEPGGAVTTRFSTAARIIADILMRFPASPAAIRAQVPLLTTRERVHVAELAARLRDSIESSGLFYEAHLLRWRGGTFPLAQLLREPQMLWSGRGGTPPQALPPPPQSDAPAASAASPANASGASPPHVPVVHPASSSPNAAAVASPAYGADGKPAAGASGGHADAPAQASQSGLLPLALARGDQPVHPALEGLLRHQLDMLAAPVLRWEGAPWAGAFMALTLQPPPHQPERERPGDEHRSRQDGDAPWQTHLTLRLARLGEVKVNLQLGAEHVALDLQAEPGSVERMDAASDALRGRLGALGFQSVALRIHDHDVSDNAHV